jgi:hypothetical protein
MQLWGVKFKTPINKENVKNVLVAYFWVAFYPNIFVKWLQKTKINFT